MNRWIILVPVYLLLTVMAYGQEADSIYKNNILVSPSFSYQPSTDVVIGAYALYQFKPKKAGPATRTSNAQFWVAQSLNKQTFLELSHEYLSAGETWYSKGKINSRFNPEYFYGIGNQSPQEAQTVAEYQFVEIEERLLKKLKNKFFVGGQLKYTWTSSITYRESEGNTPDFPPIRGEEGGQYIGFGATGLIDERNSILTPTANKYIELAVDGFFGDFTFAKIKFDFRKYWRIKRDERKVLALQYLLNWSLGEVPFKEYAKLGGSLIMRGYLEGRYRDLLASQLQAEFRWTLVGRLGVTFFGGVGNVLAQLNPDPRQMKAAVGSGVRFNINRKDPANVRIDYGFTITDKLSALYITFGEAF